MPILPCAVLLLASAWPARAAEADAVQATIAKLEAVVAGARRLSGPPQACLDACPGLAAAVAAMQSADASATTTSASSGHASSPGEQKALYDSMCQHREVYECANANAEACGLDEEKQTQFATLGCLCGACPKYVAAVEEFSMYIATMFGAAMSGATTTPDISAYENVYCAVHREMQCLKENPDQCSVVSASGTFGVEHMISPSSMAPGGDTSAEVTQAPPGDATADVTEAPGMENVCADDAAIVSKGSNAGLAWRAVVAIFLCALTF